MSIITLTTDFGLSDGYVGVMKGVILTLAPDAQLVDLSHEIAPQQVRQAAHVLQAAAPYFPAGTIHVAVVDPGVGSARRALVARTSRGFFVGPDNGVFTLCLADAPEAECHALTNPAYRLPRVSATFHGRDIFAPAAAHLARQLSHAEAPQASLSHDDETPGQAVNLDHFGPRIHDPVTLAIPQPVQQPDGSWLAHVLYADHFGNLVTSATQDLLHRLGRVEILIGERRIVQICRTFADASPGELVALVGSSGHLEISVVNGHAARTLGLGPDAPLTLSKRQAPLQ